MEFNSYFSGMENYPNYPINDQIPSSQSLKNKVLAQMKARNDNYFSNRSSLSQYIQDAEEKQRTNTAKQVALLELQKPLNKAASSKVAANAMRNIVEPGIDAAMFIEGGGLAKNAIKSGLKSMSKKAIVNGKTRLSSAEAEKIMANLQSDFLLKPNKIKEADEAFLDFKNRISTPEGEKRMKSLLGNEYNVVKKDIERLNLKSDPSEYAYYKQSYGNPLIGLHPELDPSMAKSITRHEIEHAVQRGKTTDIDKSLSNLELRKTPNNVDWSKKQKEINPQNLKNYLSNKQNATDYFYSGSSGKEKSAFLGELQQFLVDNKLISHPYATSEITAEKIKDVFIDNMVDKTYPLRIFDIIKPTDNNFKILADNLNKMLMGGGAIVGASKLKSMKKNEK